MTQRQETEAKQRLIEATTLLIEVMNTLRDYEQMDGSVVLNIKTKEKLEDKIRKFLKAPT